MRPPLPPTSVNIASPQSSSGPRSLSPPPLARTRSQQQQQLALMRQQSLNRQGYVSGGKGRGVSGAGPNDRSPYLWELYDDPWTRARGYVSQHTPPYTYGYPSPRQATAPPTPTVSYVSPAMAPSNGMDLTMPALDSRGSSASGNSDPYAQPPHLRLISSQSTGSPDMRPVPGLRGISWGDPIGLNMTIAGSDTYPHHQQSGQSGWIHEGEDSAHRALNEMHATIQPKKEQTQSNLLPPLLAAAPYQPVLEEMKAQQYSQQQQQQAIKQEPIDAPQQPMANPQQPLPSVPPIKSEGVDGTQVGPSPPPVLPLAGADHDHDHELAMMRRQGKLARFLPEGAEVEDMEFEGEMPPLVPTTPDRRGGMRSIRRKRKRENAAHVQGRSISPVLSDRAVSPISSEGEESGEETEQYTPDHGTPTTGPMPAPTAATPRARGTHSRRSSASSGRSVRSTGPRPSHSVYSPPTPPSTLSPDHGQSSSEPPVELLPVSPHELLPSRPSTGVIPPSHLKDRVVKSAKKLLTAADGVNASIQVQVIPVYYPNKETDNAHKIRLIRVCNTDTGNVSMYAHAADLGGVVERKSNISRLFGKFESPSEKLLMNVVGSKNHQVGQESNILTSRGVKKFLGLNKMKEAPAYRSWIERKLLPCLLHDPLIVATEELTIEASTDPHAPSTVVPKKLKKMRTSASDGASVASDSASSTASGPTSGSTEHKDTKDVKESKKRKHSSASLATSQDADGQQTKDQRQQSKKKQKLTNSPKLQQPSASPPAAQSHAA